MAGKTITQLPLATTPLAGTEVVPIVRSNVTYKTTVADIAKSPQDGATANAVTYYNGNKQPASSSAFTFDGTNVATTGTFSAAKLIPTGTSATGTGIYAPAANTLAWSNNGSETMRLDASGNLGLGVTPSAWGSAWKALEFSNGNAVYSNGSQMSLASNAYQDNVGWKYKTTASAGLYANVQGAHSWFTAPSGTAGNAITFTQAMTLDASGNLFVASTTSGPSVAGIRFYGGAAAGAADFSRSDARAVMCNRFGSDGATLEFQKTGVVVGTVSVTGVATTYNTSSDYRLKENIVPMTGALAKVAALKPVTYKWKADGSDGEGFIAHELAEVVPQCVTGEKDAVDAEGKPVYQGIDTSFLVATLTAAIQEQQAIIQTLTARIEALEAK